MLSGSQTIRPVVHQLQDVHSSALKMAKRVYNAARWDSPVDSMSRAAAGEAPIKMSRYKANQGMAPFE